MLLLFGRGRISDMMGDIGKGLKSFKQGMAEDEAPKKPETPRALEDRPIDVTPEPRKSESPEPARPADDSTPRH